MRIHEECKNNQISLSFENDVIDEDIQINALFERFYTADNSRSKQNSGLGLAIVKELVEKNKGSVSASLDQNRLSIQLSFSEIR